MVRSIRWITGPACRPRRHRKPRPWNQISQIKRPRASVTLRLFMMFRRNGTLVDASSPARLPTSVLDVCPTRNNHAKVLKTFISSYLTTYAVGHVAPETKCLEDSSKPGLKAVKVVKVLKKQKAQQNFHLSSRVGAWVTTLTRSPSELQLISTAATASVGRRFSPDSSAHPGILTCP